MSLIRFEPMTIHHTLVKTAIQIGKDPVYSIAGFHVFYIIDSAELW